MSGRSAGVTTVACSPIICLDALPACLSLHLCTPASCSNNQLSKKLGTGQAAHLQCATCLQACYVVASKSVELFGEITSRRKDYIARPKDNGYQSLHCTVKLPPVTVECEGRSSPGQGDAALEECLLKEGPTCELQIRTQSEPWLIMPCLGQHHDMCMGRGRAGLGGESGMFGEERLALLLLMYLLRVQAEADAADGAPAFTVDTLVSRLASQDL